MNEQEIRLIITSDNTGAITGMRQIGSEAKSTEAAGTAAFKSMSDQAQKLAATIGVVAAAYKSADLVKESTLLSSRTETLGVVMDVVGRNAGYSGDQMNMYANAVRDMGITTKESRDTVINMAQAQIDLSQASQLARVAQDAAVIGNINSSEALGRMVYGIKAAQVEVLRTVGLNVSFEDSYKKLGQALGKSAQSLSEAEKAQARTNAVLEAGSRITGAYEAAMGTANKQLLSMPRYIEEVKLQFGDLFKPAFGFAIQEATTRLKDLHTWFAEAQRDGRAQAWAAAVEESVRKIWTAMEHTGSVVKTAIGILHEYWTEAIAVATAVGTAYAVKFAAASASLATMATTVAQVGWAIQNLGFVITYFSTVTLVPLLLNPITLIAAGVGALVYLFLDWRQSIAETTRELVKFKVTVGDLEDEKAETMLKHLETTRLEIASFGGDTSTIDAKILALKQRDMWKGKKSYMDDPQIYLRSQATSAPSAEELKKIENLNERLRELIARTTGDERAMIDLQVKEWTKGHADKALIAQAKEALISKIVLEEGNKRREIVTKEIEERVKAEEQAAKRIIEVRQQEIQQDAALSQRAVEIAVQQGGMTQEQAIRNKYEWQTKSLEQQDKGLMLDQELAKTGAELNALSEKRWLLHKQIGDLKTYESFELDALRIQREKEMLDIINKERDARKQAYEGAFSGLFGQANAVGGEAGQGMGQVAGGLKTISDVATGQDPYSQRYKDAVQSYNAMRKIAEQQEVDEFELHRQYNQMKIAEDQMYQGQKLALVSSGFGMAAGAAQAFYALSGQQSKEAFAIFKAFQIAQTVVNTYSAAVGAYSALAPIPIVGPALGAAAAAAAIAFGMAQVAAIASMQPGGMAATAAAPVATGGYSYEQPTVPRWEETEKKPAPTITIIVQGNIVDQTQFARDLAPLILQAYEEGVH